MAEALERRARATRVVALWLLALWLFAQATPIHVAACAALTSCALALDPGARRRRVERFRGRWRWLAVLARALPARVAADSVALTAAVARALAGRQPSSAVVGVAFLAGGDEPVAACRRALVQAASSLPPNALALSVDRARGELVVHRLLPRPAAPASEWPL